MKLLYAILFEVSILVSVVSASYAVLKYTPSSQEAVVGKEMIPMVPSPGFTTFTITPQVPAGMIFDPETGILSGTPSEESSETTYTIIAFAHNGQMKTTTILVSVVSAAPAALKYTPSNNTKFISLTALSIITIIVVVIVVVDVHKKNGTTNCTKLTSSV